MCRCADRAQDSHSTSLKYFSDTEFAQIDTYTLRICFDDRTEQIIDFEPVLYGEVYGALRDPTFFAQVRLDSEERTLV